jgi:hypothetical protein
MRHALAAAAFLLAGCRESLLFADIEVPHIGVTLPAQAFPASDTSDPADWCDPAAPSDPPCIAATLDYDLGAEVPALMNDSVSYDLRLTEVTITLSATSAGTDLSGVRTAVVRVLDDPTIFASGAVVASYTRPPGPIPDPPPTSIAVAGNASVDLGPYLDAGSLPIRVEVELDSLTPAFDADVYAGFSLVITVDWGSYL